MTPMHLSLPSEQIKHTLSKVLGVVEQKSSRPILSYCLLTAKDDQLRLEGTDLEISSNAICEAEVTEGGKVCISPKSLYDIIREIPNRSVVMETTPENNVLKLICGEQIKATLPICPCDDYPQISFAGTAEAFSFPAQELWNIIAKTSHAICHDETRIFLNGIFLQQVEGKLIAVATNGYTFARTIANGIATAHPALAKGIIIPRKGVPEIRRLAEENLAGTLSISVDESFMYLSLDHKYHLSVRLIARDYPPYQAVIPKTTDYTLSVAKGALLDAIKRVRVLANEKTNAIKLSLDQDHQQLTISTNDSIHGEVVEKLWVKYQGETMEIGLNAHYILDALSVFGDEQIVLKFNNAIGPIVIESEANNEYMGIVMPIKL